MVYRPRSVSNPSRSEVSDHPSYFGGVLSLNPKTDDARTLSSELNKWSFPFSTCENTQEEGTALTRAVVFVRSDEFDPHAARCAIYAEEQGYELAGVIRDDWGAVQRMLGNGEASVALVSIEEHLPAERKPRIEVVANTASSRWEKRTRVIRRVLGA